MMLAALVCGRHMTLGCGLVKLASLQKRSIALKSSQVKSKQTHNQVRINAGIWRSRLLKFPDAEGLRPTPERVRQTVFNWLGQDLTGKVCLDLFAGTGAFGFEALSRNARSVTMVEYARTAFQSLQENKTLLKAEHATLYQQDALQFLQQSKTLFDIIFCDPPYQKVGWKNIAHVGAASCSRGRSLRRG